MTNQPSFNKPQWVFGFLSIWLLINLFQGIFTELFRDEAYYWMWSQHLSLGYYENAPFIGWLIALTEFWLPGELGVRLMPILMNTAALYLLYLSSDQRNPLLLFALAFSMFEVHIGGFFAAPDAPLIFFTSLFIFLLKKYLEKDSLILAIGMGITAAAIFYSKYQGLMFLFFLFLPNIALMRKGSFWVMAFTSLIFSLPLLNHLFQGEFGTLAFHLQNRSTEFWEWNFVSNYVFGQLGVAGPLMSVLLFPAAFMVKAEDPFIRSLKFCLWGILGFLLFMCTRTWVEANWSASALMPLILLAYSFINQKENWQKWVYRLAIPSLVLMFAFRLYLLVDIVPNLTQKRNEVHGWKAYMEELGEKAGDLPVVFINSYGDPAKYSFYTGKFAHSVNNFAYHKTTYDYLPFEEKILGDSVYLVNQWQVPSFTDTLITPLGEAKYGGIVPNFQTYSKVSIATKKDELEVSLGDSIVLNIQFQNAYPLPITYEETQGVPVQLFANFSYDGKYKYRQRVEDKYWKEAFDKELNKEIRFALPEEMPAGTYLLNLSYQVGWLPASINGGLLKLEVK